MLFTSLEYFFFFSFVFLYRWYVHPVIFKNEQTSRPVLHVVLLVLSYVFYMSWDYRFGALIFLSTIIDYYVALKIVDTEQVKIKKAYLVFSLVTNLVFILGFFKYYNFVGETINQLASFVGYDRKLIPFLDIILPVGISFFTFQSLSYTIDVYRGVIPCERNFVRFALFVAFFPQLVAGPIVTAKSFIPQLFTKLSFDAIPFRVAFRYIILGYFKKVILSDNASPIVDIIFANPENYGTVASWFGVVLFSIQIYCDFSGYSDMAYGSALLLGYELPENFRMPFIGFSITDIWRRWHISLSTWIRDYVYISLGGSRNGYLRHKFNLWMTMFVAGVWHGAAWTFIAWGVGNAMMLVLESVLKDFKNKYIHFDYSFLIPFLNVLRFVYAYSTFIMFGGIFRSESIGKAFTLVTNLYSFSEGTMLRPYMLKIGIPIMLVTAIGHYLGYLIFDKKIQIKVSPVLEFLVYPTLILLFSFLTNDNEMPFIYFQF
ncbi:MAG: MBOAT family protein [Leptospiraceae bacterium]|nr:MBOAT family protein [Leptospiraceae bacterium]MCP5497085.1 MBOAT family protein [Leptospiraceae bacterium]